MKLKKSFVNMNAFENWQVGLGIVQAALLFITVLAAYYIGLKQIEINDRLRKLQDYVAVSVVPAQSGKIKMLNVGKTNVYLWGVDMPGNNYRYLKPRLIPAGTLESSYYWIEPPPFPDTLKESYEFDFQLYLTDEDDNKWVSENGGVVIPRIIKENDKESKVAELRTWSYKTYKQDWSLSKLTDK